ncbi:hypothetical protein ACSTK6_01585 [Vibrio parahaemolyticus]
MKDKGITKKCDEMEAILNVMRRANDTGDDVRIEIGSGLNLLQALIAELRSVKE